MEVAVRSGTCRPSAGCVGDEIGGKEGPCWGALEVSPREPLLHLGGDGKMLKVLSG